MFKTVTFKRDVLVFRHFSRKSYALFAALGREVLIGTLSVATLTYAKADGISTVALPSDTAQLSTQQNVQLQELNVTGQRAPLTARQSAKMVTVMTREDIQRAAAVSVNDLLKQATGVDVRQRGGFGVQTDISINGGTFDQMTILLNGINISNPQTGHNAADFPVSIQDIERIEILEGAASRVYGASSFSGAINIVTRTDHYNNVRATMEGGSFGTIGAGTGVTLLTRQTRHQLSGGYVRSDGGTDNSDFGKWRGYYQGRLDTKRLQMNWQAGVSSQDYGANTFYSASFPNQYEETRRLLASVDGLWTVSEAKKAGLVIAPTIYWNRSADHYQLTRKAEGAQNGENYHLLDVYGGSLNAHLTWALGKTSLGIDLRKEHIWSTAYGKLLDENLWRDIHHSDRKYEREGNRTNTSLFLEHNILLKQVTISAGLLANRNTGLDGDFRLYPGVDVSYRPNEQWKLYASYNKALRLPTFTDLYSNNRAQRGDLNLKPERNTTYKVGVQYGTRRLNIQSAVFYNRGRDMIDWVYETAEATQYHALNIGKLDNTGASAEATLRLCDAIPVVKVGYAYIHQSHQTEHNIYKSLYALEYLRHKLTAEIDHRIVSRLSASWHLRWQERMNGYHPYTKIDCRIAWTAPRYTLYIKADNITCHRYYDYGNVKQPGLWLMAGGSIKLHL